jgi:hypothetical protein
MGFFKVSADVESLPPLELKAADLAVRHHGAPIFGIDMVVWVREYRDS